ncbi:hypothetical protein NBRC116584_29440 [Hydrogenophaga sp. 5NK40-0174]
MIQGRELNIGRTSQYAPKTTNSPIDQIASRKTGQRNPTQPQSAAKASITATTKTVDPRNGA